MRSLLPRRRTRRFIPAAAALFALAPLACEGGPDVEARRAALEQQRRQLLDQFATAQNRVRNTQAQALGESSLQPLRERFYGLLRERMIELDPRAEEWLDRAQELGPMLDELSQPQVLRPGEEPISRERTEEVVDEFAALEKTLQPLQARAMADPEVAAAFGELQDSVHAAMIRINPDAAASLDLMRRTSAAVDSIDARLRALDG